MRTPTATITIMILFTLAAVLIAGATPQQPDEAQSMRVPDYGRTVMRPGDALSRAQGMAITLAQAIEIAENETGGRATSAEADLTGEKAIHVIVVTDQAEEDLTIDSASGEITSRSAMTLPGEAPSSEVVEMASGLLYYDLREGDGPMPSGPGATVKVHYTGWFVDGTEFDSSVRRGQPAQFPLNGVIPGWTTGVGSMKVGGKRKLIIPFDLAYGTGRADPRTGQVAIPSFATLVFDVELLEIVSDGE
jgi:FKBP-type peptidyl-prolyl cis-trans isomerase